MVLFVEKKTAEAVGVRRSRWCNAVQLLVVQLEAGTVVGCVGEAGVPVKNGVTLGDAAGSGMASGSGAAVASWPEVWGLDTSSETAVDSRVCVGGAGAPVEYSCWLDSSK